MAHYGLRLWWSRSRRWARQRFLPSSSNSRVTAAGLILGSRVRCKAPMSREHLHASLALLPVDASQVDYLFDRLKKATSERTSRAA